MTDENLIQIEVTGEQIEEQKPEEIEELFG
jgi:hypothetical protein